MTRMKLVATTNPSMYPLKGKVFKNLNGSKTRPFFIEVDGENCFTTSTVREWVSSPDGDEITVTTRNSVYIFKTDAVEEQKHGFFRKAMSADLA